MFIRGPELVHLCSNGCDNETSKLCKTGEWKDDELRGQNFSRFVERRKQEMAKIVWLPVFRCWVICFSFVQISFFAEFHAFCGSCLIVRECQSIGSSVVKIYKKIPSRFPRFPVMWSQIVNSTTSALQRTQTTPHTHTHTHTHNTLRPVDVLSKSSSASQAATLKPYLKAVRHTLTAAMCMENFSSQVVERHNKPEVEVRSV